MDILLPVISFLKGKKGPLSHFLSTPPLTGRSIPFGRLFPTTASASCAAGVPRGDWDSARQRSRRPHRARRGKRQARRRPARWSSCCWIAARACEASPQSATRSFSRFLSPRCHRWRRTWASCAVLPDPRPRQRPPPPRSPSLPPPPPYTFPIRPSAAASPQLHHCHVRHKYIPPLSFLFFL